MNEYLPWIISVGTLLWSIWRDRKNIKVVERQGESVRNLETGKLDLGVAALGLQAMQAALEELRLQVQECHDDRQALIEQLENRKGPTTGLAEDLPK